MKELPSKSESELKQLAKDIAMLKVFTDRHIAKGDLSTFPMVFMPLMFANKDTLPEDVGMLYEYYDKAGPRMINGYPTFMSVQMLNIVDAEKVLAMYQEMKQKIEDV